MATINPATLSNEAKVQIIKQRRETADSWDAINLWLNEQAREKQLPPDWDWTYWLLLAGRGFGKTRTVAEWARLVAYKYPKCRIALVAATAADARDIVVDGESGILNLEYSGPRPVYQPSRRKITFSNGSIVMMYSAEKPNRLRGPQHHFAICDELAAWERLEETWSNLMFGLRLGESPQCAIATTPRPLPKIKELIKDEDCHVTTGTTYENRPNLAPKFFEKIIKTYEGTRLGAQELNAVILDDVEGALWSDPLIEAGRIALEDKPEIFDYTVTAVDPASESGETGIVTSAVIHNRPNEEGLKTDESHYYVLEDNTSSADPNEWGKAVIDAAIRNNSDYIVYESNMGGKMVLLSIETADKDNVYKGRIIGVTAKESKVQRAGPVAMQYDQVRVHHVGVFHKLEDQMKTFVPGDKSPDRLDAMVWTILSLMGGIKQPSKKKKRVKKAPKRRMKRIGKAQY